jgi:hypothetical protein
MEIVDDISSDAGEVPFDIFHEFLYLRGIFVRHSSIFKNDGRVVELVPFFPHRVSA